MYLSGCCSHPITPGWWPPAALTRRGRSHLGGPRRNNYLSCGGKGSLQGISSTEGQWGSAPGSLLSWYLVSGGSCSHPLLPQAPPWASSGDTVCIPVGSGCGHDLLWVWAPPWLRNHLLTWGSCLSTRVPTLLPPSWERCRRRSPVRTETVGHKRW